MVKREKNMEIKKEITPFTYTLSIGSDCTAEELREFTRNQAVAERNKTKQQLKNFVKQKIEKTASSGCYTAWFLYDEMKPFFERCGKFAYETALNEILEDYENRGFSTNTYGSIQFSISW